MSDDEPIDFSIDSMYSKPKVRPPTPPVDDRPSAFTPAEIRAACEKAGIVVTTKPVRMARSGTLSINWAVGDVIVREHSGGVLWEGDGAARRCLMYGKPRAVEAVSPAPPVARCPQCGFAFGAAFHTRVIFQNRRQSEIRFCSPACGADYQMGCEG